MFLPDEIITCKANLSYKYKNKELINIPKYSKLTVNSVHLEDNGELLISFKEAIVSLNNVTHTALFTLDNRFIKL